jgi:hypothetical protein
MPAPVKDQLLAAQSCPGPHFERLLGYDQSSVTLQEASLVDVINGNKMFALDFVTQAQEMKVIGSQPDYALGSVHAVTQDGTLVSPQPPAASSPSYAWGAGSVIFAVGGQSP